jgi:hypothetical protein
MHWIPLLTGGAAVVADPAEMVIVAADPAAVYYQNWGLLRADYLNDK